MLIVLVWGGMYFLAGTPISWVAGIFGVAAAGSVGAYLAFPHIRERVQKFIDPGTSDTFQIDLALQSFVDGGWLGRGPGEGQLKNLLPDAHTDFIFSVIGEEFGIFACLLILVIIAFIVMRGLISAMKEGDNFIRFCVCWADYVVWIAIRHKHGCECRSATGKGNDISIRFLWRLVTLVHVHCYGNDCWADTPTTFSYDFGKIYYHKPI